jgi:hypothetical protein
MDERRLERALRQGPPFATRYVPRSLPLGEGPIAPRPADVSGLVLLVAVTALLLIGIVGGLVALGAMRDIDRIPLPSHNAAAKYLPYVTLAGELKPGRYRMIPLSGGSNPAGWPGAVIVTVPDHWYATSGPRGGGLQRYGGSGDAGEPIGTLDVGIVAELTADPCASGRNAEPLLEPPLGHSVDDLVAGLRSLPVLEFSDPVQVTLDGWKGKRLELTHPVGCDTAHLWISHPLGGESWDTYSRADSHSTIWVIDVDGLRFVITAAYALDAPTDVQLDLQQMVESIEIDPND